MGNGVINSPSGAHEHHTDIESGLVSKDKSTYAQKSVELYYERELLRKKSKAPQDNDGYSSDEHSNQTYVNSNERVTADKQYSSNNNTQEIKNGVSDTTVADVADVSTRYGDYVKHVDVTEATVKKKSDTVTNKPTVLSKISPIATSSAKAVYTGASYLSESQSYQNDEGTGEATAHKMEELKTSAVKKVDKLTNSRYFKVSGKASDSVKVATTSSRFVTAASTAKKLGKKGISAVDNVLVNPIVKVAGDDMGSQTAVKMIETSRNVLSVGTSSLKYGYQATKATYKTGKNTVLYGKKATQNAYRYTKQAAQATAKAATKAAQATTKVVATTAKAAVATVTKVVAFIATNPIVLFAALIVLLVILIVLMCGAFIGGSTKYSSYEGAGNSATMSVNNYSAIYDYTNKAIAQRCLDLFNLQDTWTGFLEYHYEYKIEQDDGTYIESSTYPIADVAPIMAYLSVNYQSYTLTDEVKTVIDNVVSNLYTFDYLIEDCTKTVNHGTGGIDYIYGEKVTYTVIYHNAAKYFEESGYISSEKMTAYNAVKTYGDIAYFRMYNLFGDKNWHEWISEQYGYSIDTQYNYTTEKYEYEMVGLNYCTLEYKNNNNETASNLYSPLNGKVTSIIETDEYDRVITIVDSENNLEFTLMADFEENIDLMISQGDTVTAGQQIATRDYPIYIQCKADGAYISPMLIMEYFQHAT